MQPQCHCTATGKTWEMSALQPADLQAPTLCSSGHFPNGATCFHFPKVSGNCLPGSLAFVFLAPLLALRARCKEAEYFMLGARVRNASEMQVN